MCWHKWSPECVNVSLKSKPLEMKIEVNALSAISTQRSPRWSAKQQRTAKIHGQVDGRFSCRLKITAEKWEAFLDDF
jgi:hypothetical protein